MFEQTEGWPGRTFASLTVYEYEGDLLSDGELAWESIDRGGLPMLTSCRYEDGRLVRMESGPDADGDGQIDEVTEERDWTWCCQ